MPTWFDYLVESFSHGEAQFIFCLPLKTSFPPVENINESPDLMLPLGHIDSYNLVQCWFTSGAFCQVAIIEGWCTSMSLDGNIHVPEE